MSKKIDYGALPMCVAIVGSRSFEDHLNGAQKVWENVDLFVRSLKPGTLVLSGGARGVDRWAAEAADAYGLPKRVFYPDKTIRVPQRFFMRNTDLVIHTHSKEGAIAAFIDVDSCRGTTDTLEKAVHLQLPVMVFQYKQDGTFLRWLDGEEWALTHKK